LLKHDVPHTVPLTRAFGERTAHSVLIPGTAVILFAVGSGDHRLTAAGADDESRQVEAGVLRRVARGLLSAAEFPLHRVPRRSLNPWLEQSDPAADYVGGIVRRVLAPQFRLQLRDAALSVVAMESAVAALGEGRVAEVCLVGQHLGDVARLEQVTKAVADAEPV